ncbi:hypothetical protein GOB94_02250 [Granulicella sp. 5B5]|uniref:glycosyltransferase family 39 protein n=1 Tax=Granulicella sp. 5B5 TaxID=1617967 RepID=UPI0015F7717A|nr:glycosyltransferase family 39 protein [Granulicella sp. 5B5]QMV17655.1 hypothetical protein GOB94_02250 [Granulicella sp. 5B5]
MPTLSPWRRRSVVANTLTALALFLASAAFTLWQNAHVAVLWDLAYLLDSSYRFVLAFQHSGQLPYRDIPFVHPPLTFLIQAVLIRLFGRVYWHTILYAALANGAATLLTWRIALRLLPQRWLLVTLLCATLVPLGIYSVYPHPIYDSDCLLAVLLALYLLLRTEPTVPKRMGAPFMCSSIAHEGGDAASPLMRNLLAGAACVLPLFFKQNIGLPFLLIAMACIIAILITRRIHKRPIAPQLAILTGAALASAAALFLLHLTVGLTNYRYWTITFAAQRRLPGLTTLLSTYHQPSLRWTVPTSLAAILLLHLSEIDKQRVLTDAQDAVTVQVAADTQAAATLRYPEPSGSGFISRSKRKVRHAMLAHRVPNAALRGAAIALLLIPFAYAALTFFLADNPSDRADALLSLWPHLLLLATVFALYQLRLRPTILTLLPFLLLAIIDGTFLSQQLWGSTYALWPILILLLVLILREAPLNQLATPLTLTITATFLVCGTLYALSLDRLSYNNLGDRTSYGVPTGPFTHATLPALRGMATPGPYLPDFENLVRTTATLIPPGDGIVLLPGQEPFYFATGRTPRFPVLLLDPTTNPYSPTQLRDEARHRNIQWLILNTHLQLNADPTNLPAYVHALLPDFTPVRTLPGYAIYHRTPLTHPVQ